MPRSKAPDRGQALVEFALVAPIFFLLIFGVIQLGLLFGGQNGIVSSARETARYASTYRVAASTDASAVCPLAREHLQNALKRSVPGWEDARTARTITYSWLQNPDGPGGTAGSYYAQVSVRVTYHFPLYVPLLGNLLNDGSYAGQSRSLGASEEMRIENSALSAGAAPVVCPA